MIYKSKESYVKMIKPIAQKVGKKYNYLSSVLAAQCILETGYGGFVDRTTESMIDNKNHLGMKSDLVNDNWKGHSCWSGVSFRKRTPEWNGMTVEYIYDNFRVYDSVEQCLEDYCLFMTWMTKDDGTYKYRPYVIGNPDYKDVIHNVRVRGYCTDPEYETSVVRLIKEWNLTDLDEEIPDEELKPVTKKLVAPKFIDNRKASQSQVPAWRDKSEKKYIVLHFLGVVGQNFELWDNGYGATFTIAWNGDVYYTADYTAVTWQCGGKIQGEKADGDGVAPHRFYGKCTNYNSVSIEVCVKRTDNKYEGDDYDDKWYFTEESQESLVWAVSKMMDDLNIPIDRVIRHFDVSGKNCPNPYTNNKGLNGNWTWKEFKANLAQYRKDGTITLPYDHVIIKNDYLSKGDSGDAVQTMQMMLIACGYSCGSYGADGSFGTNTENALKIFQKASGLKVNGHYDEVTKSALEKAYKEKTEKKKYSTVYEGLNYSPVYNYTYYKKKYADLRKAFGTDKQKYFEHFCQFGMKEGRQGSAKFNVHKYKKRYADLRKAFGDDLKSYYKHYIQYGKKEGRKGS